MTSHVRPSPKTLLRSVYESASKSLNHFPMPRHAHPIVLLFLTFVVASCSTYDTFPASGLGGASSGPIPRVDVIQIRPDVRALAFPDTPALEYEVHPGGFLTGPEIISMFYCYIDKGRRHMRLTSLDLAGDPVYREMVETCGSRLLREYLDENAPTMKANHDIYLSNPRTNISPFTVRVRRGLVYKLDGQYHQRWNQFPTFAGVNAPPVDSPSPQQGK
jgi:hypothetical protein